MAKGLYVSELADNLPVESTFLVSSKSQGQTKSGSEYLLVRLVDRTGEIEGRIWNRADELGSRFERNDFVLIRGSGTLYQGKLQLKINDLIKREPRDVSLDDYLPMTSKDPFAMLEELKDILRRMENPYLKSLAEAFLADETLMEKFSKAPAGKTIHHPYIGGLLEHTLSLLKLILKVVENYEGIDVDLLLVGGFLHDFGKVKEFRWDQLVEYTDEGQLVGHLVMELELVADKIREIPHFPDELAMLVKHLLVSHHGAYEFGSPKLPQTLEAVILHYLDDLDGKINSIQGLLERERRARSRWSSFHRAYNRAFFRTRDEPIR
jgi:3'-5' exoribonuclease